jgi:DNA invertase Pin-like site-specific DNA recombinase
MGDGKLTAAEARWHLESWGQMYAQRDAIIREAYKARLRKSEIARLTGLSRSTVTRIIEENPADVH